MIQTRVFSDQDQVSTAQPQAVLELSGVEKETIVERKETILQATSLFPVEVISAMKSAQGRLLIK